MWPFKRTITDAQWYDQRLRELERRQLDLEAQLTELHSKHMSLRGRVYGAGIHKHPVKDDEQAQVETIPRSKDELRKIAGIKAGQPYPHKD